MCACDDDGGLIGGSDSELLRQGEYLYNTIQIGLMGGVRPFDKDKDKDNRKEYSWGA